jgi:glycosyltransferase involved in cell wall biosynthesis
VEGGVEKHVSELSAELVRRGHSVDVYTSNETRSAERLAPYSEMGGIRIHRYRSLASLGEFGKVWPGFTTEIAEGNYDVIHAHVYRHPHTDLSVLISKIKGARSVMTSHSPFHPPGTRGPFANALAQVYDTMVAPFSLRAFDSIISLTPSEVEHLVALGARKDSIRVISHGVSEDNFREVVGSSFLDKFGLERKGFVLYLGRIHPTKGVNILLDSFAGIVPGNPNVRLVIAGPSTSEEEKRFEAMLRSRVGTLGLGGKVVFAGMHSEDEKLAAYSSCKLFVLPSLYEPYGIVLLEAAAHCKPLVSTLTDGPMSIIEDGVNGFLVRSGDHMQLARAIETLLSDEDLVERMSIAARTMASFHSWERVATQVEETYHGDHRAN